MPQDDKDAGSVKRKPRESPEARANRLRRNREYARKNKEKIRERKRRYRTMPDGKEKIREYRKRTQLDGRNALWCARAYRKKKMKLLAEKQKLNPTAEEYGNDKWRELVRQDRIWRKARSKRKTV